MPQETNLNVSPYFDDFDVDKNYYKLLFKPTQPLQARELNSLQSILQNQVEQFGNHIFKEGSVVIPGQLSIGNPFHAVEIEPQFNGILVSAYFNEILGKTIPNFILKNTKKRCFGYVESHGFIQNFLWKSNICKRWINKNNI